MAELAVPGEARGRVVTQPVRDEVSRERVSEPVEGRSIVARKRHRGELLEPVAIAPCKRTGDCDGVAEERGGEAPSRRASKEGNDAILRRERPVDVESGDNGTRGGGFRHRRTRLYTRCMSDGPEIFDDLYLGLQAGGALRKQRRGEELTEEEREAIGRWQQMSMWRKGVAVGAFAVGTFGLGFTLGGLVFGRRARKA